ncbi:hypothetical protein BC939DRAFT_506865 [Gamsiella multidivaricata]|uniref:uncharacterized protein n=1 Tax=Gamsiella multidivaricata TaxID=101098 RepID=UPI00221E8518|nr:uncharacterized protein BC939DRAFT_506865 [Gamsiella multidivaricata]KAI7818115.1 hypothetical protein BC939DRAFT_506865 [Gamsiella multidivaricata]
MSPTQPFLPLKNIPLRITRSGNGSDSDIFGNYTTCNDSHTDTDSDDIDSDVSLLKCRISAANLFDTSGDAPIIKTTTTPVIGITQTMIVTTSKNSSSSTKVGSMVLTSMRPDYSSSGQHLSELHVDRLSTSRSMTVFTRNADEYETKTQGRWSESQQQQQQQQAYRQRLERSLGKKSQGAY